VEALRRHADLQAQGTKVFPGTTTTNTQNDPAAPEVSTTGDHRRIFTPHGAPTGRRSADFGIVLPGIAIGSSKNAVNLGGEDEPGLNEASRCVRRCSAGGLR
jgi:hypothetical protein